MLKLDSDYIKYDMTLQEYYITVNAITNYTPYSSDDLGNIFGNAGKALKVISHSVYRHMYSYRRGYEHKKFIIKKIYENKQNEVNALMLAMIEAVKGAVESGMDLNAYTNEPKDTLPSTVIEELKTVRLVDGSQKIDHELDIDYTEAEINAT